MQTSLYIVKSALNKMQNANDDRECFEVNRLTSKHSRSSFAFCCCLAKMDKIVISYFKRETNFGFLVKTESIVIKVQG